MADSAVNSAEEATVRVSLGPRSYDIAVSTGRLAECATRVDEWLAVSRYGGHSRLAMLVSDLNVSGTHAKALAAALEAGGWRCERVELAPGERSKSLDTTAAIYGRLAAMNADRKTVVFAVGGGVVGDVAGFAAATYARGLPFVQVPTTLLAQVDSSVGGKVGVNLPEGKNLVGAFHQPLGVWIDTETLVTLPDRDYRSGLAEVVKYGVILDEALFGYLGQHIGDLLRQTPHVVREVIARCCRLKADIVEEDEQEVSGRRAVLNYGHTFAHAFEALAGYGELLHGEAVAIGMVCASRLAERMGLVASDVTQKQVELLEALGLPSGLPAGVSIEPADVLERMKRDKKAAAGVPRFVLPTRIGHVDVFEQVDPQHVHDVLREAASLDRGDGS